MSREKVAKAAIYGDPDGDIICTEGDKIVKIVTLERLMS